MVLLLAAILGGIAFGVAFYRRPLWVVDGAMRARLALSGIRSKFATVGPYRVHYFAGGRGAPLLLIHGLGSRSQDWTPEMPAYVKAGFRVYAIDLLGCGRTDQPDIAYTIQEQTELVHGFLDAVHVQQADVVGWSMGGWIALNFALQHPARVRRVVAMGSAGLSFQTDLTPEIFQPRTIPELMRFEALLVARPPRVPAFFHRILLRAMQSSHQVMHRTVSSMQTGKDLLDGKLEKIQAPVLLVWGAEDRLIPPSVAFRMHRELPQSVLQLYSGCGHLAPATCAGKIVPRVLEFLKAKSPAKGGVYRY